MPPQYDPQTASSAEKRIFHLLENDPDTTQWFVLHSLGLSKRPSGPYGEIDFVVLIPSGVIICLEVKGGNVTCKDGVWQTIDRYGTVTQFRKSPFMQAREGMFALMHAIHRKFGAGSDAAQCLFAYVVIFPDVESPPRTPEFEPWEAIGREHLNAPLSRAITHAWSAQRKKIGTKRLPPSPESTVREIRQFLRPDFERIIARPTVIHECENSLVSLTEDQYQVLDMISDNPRCLIEGAAGTGKTLLALEYSRRQAATGRRVLLLCFNRLLGEWFESRPNELSLPNLRATSYHRFLRGLVVSSEYKEEFERVAEKSDTQKLFAQLLPFYALLACESASEQFDVLVIDEAQDLVSQEALELLGILLKGGIAGGQWHVFGDFTRQCIYGGSSREARLQTLASACSHFTHAHLQTNCRNTRRIGEETALLSGFPSPPYKLGQVDGLAVDYRYWRTPQEQLEKLSDTIRELLGEGLNLHDIVLLSPRKLSDSVASRLSLSIPKYGKLSAAEIRSGVFPYVGGTRVAFATIHAFKGMESSVIILCDVDHVDSEGPEAMLYTGMSRARSLLVMLVHDSVRSAISQSLARKLSDGWKL